MITLGLALFAAIGGEFGKRGYNKSLAYYGGDIAISGMGIINSVLTVIQMPLFGINQGVQPIIGYNYGARRMTG